ISRLGRLKVDEDGVCKVVKERAYSLAWHPSSDKLLLAAGDKVGHVGIWTLDSSDEGEDGVFLFKPHTRSVPRLEFDPADGHKLLSTSYDGTVRRMDVEAGAFEQVYANEEDEQVSLTSSYLVPMERTLLLCDDTGAVSGLDLRTNKEVWRCSVHEKKVNSVHGDPKNGHVFVTASLDRTVKLWDARRLEGKGRTGGAVNAPAEMPHFRSVNSAHFSPGAGEWVVTVGQDDKIRLFRGVARAMGTQVKPEYSLPHNNQTGRWLTKFQASWDPKDTGLFAIGSMQKSPHAVSETFEVGV
ncbi:unnamed protein product, partial [Discosporangium mesarthrocarpum]